MAKKRKREKKSAPSLKGKWDPKMKRPITFKPINRTAKEGLKDSWIRASFIIKEDSLKKLKTYAFREGRYIKEIVTEALEEYLKDKEAKPVRVRQSIKLSPRKQHENGTAQVGATRLYSTLELAHLLKLTPPTVRRYIEQGTISGQKIKGRFYVTEDNLRKFRNENP